MKRYLSMLYRENNYLRVQELSMDLLSIDMHESEVNYYLIRAMLMSESKTLSQIYFRQEESYLPDEHMQRIVVKPSANKPCTISEMRRSLRITERQPTAPTIGIA